MHYYWIPAVVLLMIALLGGASTWSPFQSQQVKEICSHMTKAERIAVLKRGGLCGLLIGIIPGAIGLVLGPLVVGSALLGVILCALLFPLVALLLWTKWLPYCSRSQQSLLASTEWASGQGMKADDIRLYNWQE